MNTAVLEIDYPLIAACMPAYMLCRAVADLKEKGFEVRQDVEELANRASVRPLFEKDVFTIKRVATKLESHVNEIFRESSADSPVQVLAGTARLLVKLTKDGMVFDQDTMLVALLYTDDMDVHPEDWPNPKVMNRIMSNLGNAARRRGFLVPTVDDVKHY